VPWIKVGDRVGTGQRVGLIRFGSRVDVYLPAGTSSQVLLGQRTVAGETIVARAGISELIEGVAQ
jgi:phosphatidylserine decarboxylase